MVWGSFLIASAAAALKTPTRNGYNAQGVNLTFHRNMKTEMSGYKTLLIPAAAGFFSLDATSGLLATASASAPAMFLALRSALLFTCA